MAFEVALGLVGLFGGFSAATYAMAQIHFTAKDIELAKKRIEFVAQEQIKVNAELGWKLIVIKSLKKDESLVFFILNLSNTEMNSEGYAFFGFVS